MTGYWNLPAGWDWRRLPTIAQIGRVKGQAGEGPFYDLTDDPWKRPEERPATPGAQFCNENCILIGTSQRQMKVVVPATSGLASAGWKVVQPAVGADREFLAWYLRAFSQLVPATIWTNLVPRSLDQLQIPFPRNVAPEEALRMQKRIAIQLDQQLHHWREANRLASEIQRDVDTLVAAAVHEVFESKQAANWPLTALGAIADLRSGKRRSASTDPSQPRFVDIGAMSASSQALQDVKWEELPGWQPTKGWNPEDLLREGDILLQRSGADTGRVFRLNGPVPPAVCTESFFRVRSLGVVDQGFLYWLLNAPAVQRNAAGLNRSAGPKSTNKGEIKAIAIRVPAAGQQQVLGTYLDRVAERALALARQQRNAAQLLEQVAAAIYRQAFVAREA